MVLLLHPLFVDFWASFFENASKKKLIECRILKFLVSFLVVYVLKKLHHRFPEKMFWAQFRKVLVGKAGYSKKSVTQSEWTQDTR
jgi:hypothetical protein